MAALCPAFSFLSSLYRCGEDDQFQSFWQVKSVCPSRFGFLREYTHFCQNPMARIPLFFPSASHNLVFNGLGFKVSSGRGFCGSASEEVWKADYLYRLAEYLLYRLPSIPSNCQYLTPGNGGEGQTVSKTPLLPRTLLLTLFRSALCICFSVTQTSSLPWATHLCWQLTRDCGLALTDPAAVLVQQLQWPLRHSLGRTGWYSRHWSVSWRVSKSLDTVARQPCPLDLSSSTHWLLGWKLSSSLLSGPVSVHAIPSPALPHTSGHSNLSASLHC